MPSRADSLLIKHVNKGVTDNLTLGFRIINAFQA